MKQFSGIIILLLAILTLESFQIKDKNLLIGKWQATNIDAPSQDSILSAQMNMQFEQIDSLTDVDSGMIERFHTSDLETIKKMAKEEVAKQPEQMKQQMKDAAADFSFDLMKDGKATTMNKDKDEPSKWYLGDDDRKLFIDPFEVKNEESGGNKNVMIFDIISLSVDSLRLRVHQPLGQDVFVDFVKKVSNKKKH